MLPKVTDYRHIDSDMRPENMTLSVKRYNQLLRMAIEETKIGGDIERAKVFAMLAQAEATILGES